MPRFYFEIDDPSCPVESAQAECPDANAAEIHAWRLAKAIEERGALWLSGLTIEVTDDVGAILRRIPIAPLPSLH